MRAMTATTTSPAVTRQHLLAAFDDILQPGRFKDYGPNGLQVEGKAEIRTLVSGVTASPVSYTHLTLPTSDLV